MSLRHSLRLAGVAALVSCGKDDVVPPAAVPVSLSSAGYTVRVSSEITFLHGEDVLLRFPLDGLQLGTVAAVDAKTNYDPWGIVVPNPLYRVPEDLVFRSAVSVEAATAGDALTAHLAFEGGARATLTVAIETKPGASGASFRAKLVPEGAAVGFMRLRPRADAKEAFYGLGESFDDVNQRGKIRAMQIELDGDIESAYNDAHVPIPLLLGTRGWGLFVESRYPSVFDVATQKDDLVEVTVGTGMSSASQGLTFHLFGDVPLDLTRHYYEVTGFPHLPSRWALGPWLWRDGNRNQAQLEDDADKIRTLDLPFTGMWIDNPYQTAVSSFAFDPARFTDQKAMITKVTGLGLPMAAWSTPYLDERSEAGKAATASLRAEADGKGYYPKTSGLLVNQWGRMIDFTNPAAYAWWQGLARSYADLGLVGFKLDYGEDVIPGIFSGRNVWEFADGSNEQTMHSLFTHLHHRVYAETLPKDGGFLLCRHGTYGDQVNASVIWPGDLDSSWSRRGEKRTAQGKTFNSVGGLPASVVAGLSLGPSGFPLYGADTGGYRHAPPGKELYTRWFEQTALSTVMQVGDAASDVPWEFTKANGWDDETLATFRVYARLHVRLFPYEWTFATNLAKDGRPIARPLGLAYPELGVHPNDEYLFGDALLVAPVVTEAATKRVVVFPPGRWIDWWTGAVHQGTETVDAPLGTLPLFAREGALVPMLRPTIDAIAPTTSPDRVDSFATAAGPLHVRVAPGPKASFTVFDGTALTSERTATAVTLSATKGAEFTGPFVFEAIALAAKPKAVRVDGADLPELPDEAALAAAPRGYRYDPATGGTLIVKIEASGTIVVTQ